jgi:hypothetical protein
MTAPQPATLDREKDKLYVTDVELIRRLGVPYRLGRRVIAGLDQDRLSGFPPKQKLWGNRRYWPHVSAWLDRTGANLGVPNLRRSA